MKYLSILAILFSSIAQADLNRICDATVIVVLGDNELSPLSRPPGGTATFVAEDSEKYYLITAGHVVDTAEGVCKIASHRTGKQTKLVPAKVEWYKYANDITNGFMIDAAVISVKKTLWRYKTKLVPIFKEKSYKKGMSVDSSGYPAPWPTLFRGSITEVYDHGFKLYPGCKPGRSGSGVINSVNNHFLGLIALNTGYSVGNNQIHKMLMEDGKLNLIKKVFK